MGILMQFGLALGLAGAAGMRAYFPLILMSLLTRFSDTIAFSPPFTIFSSVPFLFLIILLALYEIGGQKVTGTDGNQVLVNLIIRLMAGALLFTGVFQRFGMVFGLIIGGALTVLSYMIIVKLTSREGPVPFMNGEDFRPIFEESLSVIVTVLSILLPWAAYLIWGALLFIFIKRFKDRSYIKEPRMKVWR